MHITRSIDLIHRLKKKSFFLLGPRSTGKSWLIRNTIEENPKIKIQYINLLSTDIYLRLSQSPSLLEDLCRGFDFIAIDEIQKIPSLLNEVHLLIEEKGYRFILTGSSARKLRRESTNLLGGRASQILLFGFTYFELKEKFKLKKFLHFGGLPRIYLSENPFQELDDYLSIYLDQEIKIEANLRNLPPFSRFLKVSALGNGQLINYSSLASDCGVSANTIKEYYQILDDTLLGSTLDPWLESKKRKAITTAKFYYFDLGVRNFLAGLNNISESSKEWGELFEHFIINEVRAYISYRQKRAKMYFWRNTSRHEVDLVLDNDVAIEIKATQKIQDKHLRGLKAIQEENILKRFIIISQDKLERKTAEGFEIMYWENFLDKLWNDLIL